MGFAATAAAVVGKDLERRLPPASCGCYHVRAPQPQNRLILQFLNKQRLPCFLFRLGSVLLLLLSELYFCNLENFHDLDGQSER